MRQRTGRALGVCAALLIAVALYLIVVARWLPEGVTALAWPGGDEDPGGWSGLEVSDDGARFWAITDDAHYAEGTLTREEGRLTGAALTRVAPLPGPTGRVILPPYHDSEGLARDASGRFAVSFEWQHRVWIYDRLDAPPRVLAPDPRFQAWRGNTGPEAVALDSFGRPLVFRERSGLMRGPRQSYLREHGGPWGPGPALPSPGNWSASGADIGPDGALYILERRFRFIGFASRIRRLDLTAPGAATDPDAHTRTVYSAPLGRHGNLEGLGIWADPQGRLHALMVSDDNHLAVQRGHLVEVRLPLAP